MLYIILMNLILLDSWNVLYNNVEYHQLYSQFVFRECQAEGRTAHFRAGISRVLRHRRRNGLLTWWTDPRKRHLCRGIVIYLLPFSVSLKYILETKLILIRNVPHVLSPAFHFLSPYYLNWSNQGMKWWELLNLLLLLLYYWLIYLNWTGTIKEPK